MSYWNSCFQSSFFILTQNSTWNTLGYVRFLNAFKPSIFYTENGGCRIHWNVEMLNLKMVQQSKKMMLINLLRLFLKSLSLWLSDTGPQKDEQLYQSRQKKSSSIPISQELAVGSDFALTEKYYKWQVWSFFSLMSIIQIP